MPLTFHPFRCKDSNNLFGYKILLEKSVDLSVFSFVFLRLCVPLRADDCFATYDTGFGCLPFGGGGHCGDMGIDLYLYQVVDRAGDVPA